MKILSTLFNFLSGDVIEQVAGIFKDYSDKKLSKDELRFKLETFEASNTQSLAMAQIEVNKTEAQHASVFVSGWRPMLGWVCGLGFAMNFLIAPIGTFLCAILIEVPVGGTAIVFPQADVSTMMPVLVGMLGLGGLRSFEKLKGVNRNQL